MNKFFIVLIIIGVYILSRKHKIYEGISNQNNSETKKEDEKNDNDDIIENCNYRNKNYNGTMCEEKWGEPPCESWKKVENVKKIETSKKPLTLKGYYSNDFMYEIDYSDYNTNLIEKEEGDDDAKLETNIPRGVHSSFF